MAASFCRRLIRKKILSEDDLDKSELDRCLTTVDLIGLGIGSTLGAGLYVVAGQVAHDDAGPAVTISFLVAALASALAGMCYAEFAARIPRAGSAYVYSYVTVGEFMAFVIGWNLVLEYVIGTASVARAWSSYFDSVIDYKISNFFNSTMPIRVAELSDYPDFFAFGITLILTGLLSFGVKESTRFNNFFTAINLLVVLYVTICGLFKVDSHNWSLDESEVPKGFGTGGFMPYGFSGMMRGAATCFYAFVGFDCVATTGEETQNPQKSIPIGIIVSLFVIFLSYFSVSAVITLMCPYYLLDVNAALPAVFDRAGWGVARYIITVGAICGLTTSLMGGMFPLPRILYAMGNDGIIYRFMGRVSERFKTPLIGTIISGIFAGLMAMLFNLAELVNMMSIGTLLAYTLVGISVLILRYEADANLHGSMNVTNMDKETRAATVQASFTITALLFPESVHPTLLSAIISKIAILAFCIACSIFSLVTIVMADELNNLSISALILTTALGSVVVVCFLVVFRQPQSGTKLAFKVPLVPFVPMISVFVNIYLMLKLPVMTWLRFAIWLAVGFVIYFTYGICNAAPYKAEDLDTEITVSSESPDLQESEPQPILMRKKSKAEKSKLIPEEVFRKYH